MQRNLRALVYGRNRFRPAALKRGPAGILCRHVRGTRVIPAWLAFPIVLLVLAVGCGLLLARVAGGGLPGPLLVPAGLAVVMVVGQFMTVASFSAKLATPLVVALALVGFVLSRSERPRLDWWAAGCGLGAFAVYGAPIVLSGDPTVAGYLKIEDTATWATITDHVMKHGRSLADVPPSSYEAILRGTLGLHYPVGSFMPWGVARPLVGQDLAWLLQPYIAFLAAALALALYELAAPLVPSRPLRALVAFLASQPALLFGFALWGAIKEPAAAALIAFLAALVPGLLRDPLTPRRLVPLAVGSAALIANLSIGGGVWLAPLLIPPLWLIVQERGRVPAIRGAVAFVVLTAVLAIPTLALTNFLSSGSESFTGAGELGNLIEPLNLLQIFGVWPSGDFRVTPDSMLVPGVLILLVAGFAIAGLALAWQRRAFGIFAFVIAAAVGTLLVAIEGSPWLVSKALAEASPAFVLAALVGAVGVLTDTALSQRVRLPVTAIAIAAIGAGVLWSNALAYREVDLAPHARFAELETIGKRIAGEGPTLTTEYEFWGVRHFLRDAQPNGASLLSRQLALLRPNALVEHSRAQDAQAAPSGISLAGGPPPEGLFFDIDDFQTQSVLGFRTLVLRRSPVASRPPFPYKLTWSGHYYEVWQRPAGPAPTVPHLPLGKGLSPVARGPCNLALGGVTRLATVFRPAPIVVPLGGVASASSQWERGPDPALRYPRGAGSLATTVDVPRAGRYGVWLGGSFRGTMEAFVDGKRTGSARNELNYSKGQYEQLGSIDLPPGRHEVKLHYGGASLRPGSGGDAILPLTSEEERGESKRSDKPFGVGPLVLSTGTADQQVTYLPVGERKRLCRRTLDWIEGLGPAQAGSAVP
jgi:hypothetical protein